MTTTVLETAMQPVYMNYYPSSNTTNNHSNNNNNNTIATTSATSVPPTTIPSTTTTTLPTTSNTVSTDAYYDPTSYLPSNVPPPSFPVPAKQQIVFSNPWTHDAAQNVRPAPPRARSAPSLQPLAQETVPAELRRNPRRVPVGQARPEVPSMVNQSSRKVSFVDRVVASATDIVKTIWPQSSNAENGSSLSLRAFIQETLRRSRTSFSTLQIALYYLILVRPHVVSRDPSDRALGCGRRMFLSALILASKYLQDRNYSARAWAKISGLSVTEINQNEMAFLIAIDWRLYVATSIFEHWTVIVGNHAPSAPPPSPNAIDPRPAAVYDAEHAKWRAIIRGITPQLDNLDAILEAHEAAVTRVSPPVEHNICRVSCTPPARGSLAIAMAAGAMRAQTCSSVRPASISPPPRRPSTCSVASMLSTAPAYAISAAPMSSSSRYSVSSSVSLARSASSTTYSVTSSPESMVSDLSDSSRSSRSSSISSASSLPGVQPSLGVQARIRQATQCREKAPTDRYYPETAIMSSPELLASYAYGHDAAARALAELQYGRVDHHPKQSLKRSRCMLAEAEIESGFACPKISADVRSCRKRARVNPHETATFVHLQQQPECPVPHPGPGMWAGVL